MRAEAEARQKLAGAICELERYQSVYGKLSTFPPDTQSLAKQLQEKEDEIKRLKLLDQQREQVFEPSLPLMCVLNISS